MGDAPHFSASVHFSLQLIGATAASSASNLSTAQIHHTGLTDCPSSVPPACKQSSAPGNGSGREYSVSSWSPSFQPSTFTISSWITVNTILNVSFNNVQNWTGFISNFLLLVTTLFNLVHAGKKRKKIKGEKEQAQKCLEISHYDEARNYFYFTKARDTD